VIAGLWLLVTVHVTVQFLHCVETLRTDAARVLLLPTVHLLHMVHEGGLLDKELVAVDTLEGRSVLVGGALGVALCNVLLEVLWEVKAFLALTALLSVLHLPVLHPGARLGAVLIPFVNLHVSMQGTRGQEPTTTNGTFIWLVGRVRLQVDLQVITSGECGITFTAVVLLVSSVQLYVAVSAPLVFEQPTAVGAFERQLVTVTLLMVL
jgi:hypothetical protein